MTTTAFPVRQTEAGVGCTDIAMRKIFGALYPDKGVITGLSVKGGNSLSYTVSEGVAVCSKGSADGSTLAYFEGGSVDVSANSSSNPRIDVVWITSHDITQGDSDNLVTIGVTEGAAAATPTEPDVPSYATKICAMQVPAQATTTASATAYGSQDMAVPYGASLGLLGEYVDTSTVWQNMDSKWYTQSSVAVTLPTKRIVEVVYEARATTQVSGKESSYYVKLTVDGTDVTDGSDERLVHNYWLRDKWSIIKELDAGTHTIQIKLKANSGAQKYQYEGWRATRVWDRGVAD